MDNEFKHINDYKVNVIIMIILIILGIASITSYFILNKKVEEKPEDEDTNLSNYVDKKFIPELISSSANEKTSYLNKNLNINVVIQNGVVKFNKLINKDLEYVLNAKYILANEFVKQKYIELLVLSEDKRAYLGIIRLTDKGNEFSGFSQIKADSGIVGISRADNIKDEFPDVYNGFYVIKENGHFYSLNYGSFENVNASLNKNYNEIYIFKNYVLIKEYDNYVKLYAATLFNKQLYLYKYIPDSKQFIVLNLSFNNKPIYANKIFVSYQKTEETLYVITKDNKFLYYNPLEGNIESGFIPFKKYTEHEVLQSSFIKINNDRGQVIITYDNQSAEDFDCILTIPNLYEKRIIGF